MSYIVSVGAGINQVPLIRKFKENSFKIISFDANSKSPGKKYSDLFNNISTWNYKDALEWLKVINKDYIGIGCFSYGNAILTQQYLLNYYDLPCKIKLDYIFNVCDKHKLRDFLKINGVSNLIEMDNKNFNMKLIKNKCKYVIKDKLGGSSRNIRIMYGHEVIDKINLNEGYIIQEYISGVEYRIVSLIQNKKIMFMAVMKKENLKNTTFTARLTPINNDLARFKNIVNKIIDIFDVEDTIIKIDVICGEVDEIIEIDFGIGGDCFETLICPNVYNYDIINNYIKLITKKTVCKYDYNLFKDKFHFDYIFNINYNKYFNVDLKNICEMAHKIFKYHKLIYLKNNLELIRYPTSNMDAIFGVLHSEGISNLEINNIFNRGDYI